MVDKTQTHHGVGDLAARQHGVVSARQLGDLDLSRATVSDEVARGRLYRVHRGVYAVGHPNISRQAWGLAAVLAYGDGALLSHRSAAWLWGLTRRWWLPIEVTAVSSRHQRADIRVHSSKTLLPSDVDASEGIPVTAVPRTLLDFAAVDPRFLARALDNAERLGLLDLLAIDALLARSDGLRGVARLREAIGLYRLPGDTRSGLERRFIGLVHNAGLPLPAMNYFIAGYTVDAYWPTERFAVELDTYDYHGSHAAFEDDRVRQEDLKLAGIEMIRITGLRIDKEPKVIADRLCRLLAQRRRELNLRQPK